MSAPFIPNRDAEFDGFVRNFRTLVVAAPGVYGLTAEDALAMVAAADAWAAAWSRASNRNSRTSIDVLNKREQRKACTAVLRRLAGLVRANASVTPAQLISLGLIPPPHAFPRRRAIEDWPQLFLMDDTGLQHTIRVLRPPGTGRARPEGAMGLLLCRTVAPQRAESPAGAEPVTVMTLTRKTVDAPPAPPGWSTTYFARWIGPRGTLGPWSMPLRASVRVQQASTMPLAA
ncbi:MAG TPA: hypothetical protein VD997_16115 [Phycisphaerales bacterium]|nr:hypothetical protein [Phycisphaerales bacterium]